VGNGYFSFLKQCSEESVWWWATLAILTVSSAVIMLFGSTPNVVKTYWHFWVIALLLIMFLSVNGGAYSLYRKQRNAYEARISELEARNAENLAKRLSDIQEQNDARDIPDVILEMREASNEERIRLKMANRNFRGDENWYVHALPRREERLVRKAFKEWGKDNLR